MAEVLWYYAKNDQQLGPVSPAELKQLAATRALLPEDLIWREGMESWAAASKVKGLFPEPREPAPTAPVSNGPTETMPPTAVAAILGGDAIPPPTPNLNALPELFPVSTASSTDPRAIVQPPDQRSAEPSGWAMVDLLWWSQATLWGICIAVVFLGGLLFTRAFMRAKSPTDEAAAAAVFSTFFIGAYVVARAGERVAALLQTYFERRRK